jgi:hypothetical protein
MITLALNILDIAQNSISAKASEIMIGIKESKADNLLEITIKDNGRGIPGEIMNRVTDPFVTTRTTRKTGFGLPLLKFHSNLTGGDIAISSGEGRGTSVIATFSLSHPDRQPLGDIAGVMTILMTANPEINFLYGHKTDSGDYNFSSKEIKDYLGIDNFNDSRLLADIKEMINQNLKDIGVCDINKN